MRLASFALATAIVAAPLALAPSVASAQRAGGRQQSSSSSTGSLFDVTPYAGYMVFGDYLSGPLGTSLHNAPAPIIGVQLGMKIAPDRLVKLLDRATASTLNVIEGQAQEFVMKEEVHPNLARYTGVIRGKTSGLFALPIVGAMEALGLEVHICRIIERAAMDLGPGVDDAHES